MKTTSNTVLITGGASGIGFALAEKFLGAGNTVIICGRRGDKLKEAKAKHPNLHTRVADAADAEGRAALAAWAAEEFPDLNVLVNNAGIQKRIPLRESPSAEALREELVINLEAPIHLTTLLLPHLIRRKDAAVVNVTSGLAFSPLANVPVYSATKAALRSFTLSLRHQLIGTSVSVVEIIPPAVDTDLGGVGLHTFGAPLGAFTDSIWQQLEAGSQEASFGFGKDAAFATREQLETIFKRMNPIA